MNSSLMDYTRVWLLNIVFAEMPRATAEAPLRIAPIILLADEGKRAIAIPISKDEVPLIEEALEEGTDALTVYHLLVTILGEHKTRIDKILIYDLSADHYYARLSLETEAKTEPIEVEAKPADAIVISVLAQAPIYVKEKIMQEFSADVSSILT